MFLQVADAAVDDCAGGGGVLGAGGHEAAVDGVDGVGGGGDEEDGVGWDGVDVVTLELGICAVVLTDVFYSVRGPDDLCRTFLAFRRPHCEIGQKSTMRMIQFE